MRQDLDLGAHGFRDPLYRLGRHHDALQLSEVPPTGVEGLLAPDPAHQPSHPQAEGRPDDVQSLILADHLAPVKAAVVIGSLDRHGAEDRQERFGMAVDKRRLVPLATGDVGPGVPPPSALSSCSNSRPPTWCSAVRMANSVASRSTRPRRSPSCSTPRDYALDFARHFLALLGTLRRECLDFLIPLNEDHLRLLFKEWVRHYNRGRPHASLGPGIPGLPPELPAPRSSAIGCRRNPASWRARFCAVSITSTDWRTWRRETGDCIFEAQVDHLPRRGSRVAKGSLLELAG